MKVFRCIRRFVSVIATVVVPALVFSQHNHGTAHDAKSNQAGLLETQPFLAQAIRLQQALRYLGSALSAADEQALAILQNQPFSGGTNEAIQKIFDPYCLALVHINPEARVKVDRGAAVATLSQNGWKVFLVKVKNEAGVTAQLQAASPNAIKPVHSPSMTPVVAAKDLITPGQVASRFLDLQVYRGRPMLPHLSGLLLEYAIVQIYSKDAGQREAQIGFNIGQGSEDIGFRNTISILFTSKPSVKVRFDVIDADGRPTTASFLITDSVERIPGKLRSVYPLPSRRVAAYDAYPDFFFQQQIYRADGESVHLSPGTYNIRYTRGPEYILKHKRLVVPEGADSLNVSFRLERWIEPNKMGWYSADHHIHASGCSHYDSPEEGVPPAFMWRQVQGEDLNVGAVLTWGPSWYHQKQYFATGGLETPGVSLMRYDVEVSGFPSSHAGHLVLLQLKEDDYPGTKSIEDWPSWTIPVLRWAKNQGGTVGYAHSGWGLEPVQPTKALPNYELPKMDGIGANEYIVAITQNLVDFYSVGDTPATWELNMWYHTLNCGFRIPISGETDFPCITDNRVGMFRSYFKPAGALDYSNYVAAIKRGHSYASDGRAHLMDFAVNGVVAGTSDSEVKLKKGDFVKITATVAAYLPELLKGDTVMQEQPFNEQPYWHLEWARQPQTRNVNIELIVNGVSVDTLLITANGNLQNISFSHPIHQSSWVALRISGSAHSNPVYVLVDGAPIKLKKSAAWCKEAVKQCWKMKSPNIRKSEQNSAKEGYQHAEKVYEDILKASTD